MASTNEFSYLLHSLDCLNIAVTQLVGDVQAASGPAQQPPLNAFTPRDMFALGAMQSLIMRLQYPAINVYRELSCEAYVWADAMMSERERQIKEGK